MQCNEAGSIPQVLLESQNRFHTLMDSVNSNPKVAAFLDTSLGKFLNDHPFLALHLLVFGALAVVPIVLFLVFALVTFISTTVGFVFFEVFLLALGGATLLCVLCGVAVVSVVVSLTLSALYITTVNLLNLYYSQRISEEKSNPTKIQGSKKQ